jgi:hypothetical protein
MTNSISIGKTNIKFGWAWLFIAILTGMVIGLFAFGPDWLDGYASLTRRFLRLAHISFMALSLTNVLYGLTLDGANLPVKFKKMGSYSMITAAILMPTICLLSAWKAAFQVLFFMPASAFAIAVLLIALGYFRRT